MRKSKVIAAALGMMLLAGCANNTVKNDNDRNDEGIKAISSADALISEMTDSEKVAQLFLARADGDDLDFILEKNPGGLVMFGSNFKDKSKDEVKDEIKGYQEKCEIPLIIAVDEEGGTVVRVSSNPALSDEKFLSPQEYYNEGGAELAVEKEKKKCGILKELGINMNLAPVADVSLSPSDFIYDRSLGQSAEITSQYIGEVVAEMKNEGMASCLKHFPGYGSNADTHTGIAVDERLMRTFQNSDFLPFMTGIEAGADAVLVSHNIVTCMDAELPSSLSPAVHDILRSDLEFDGLIITDDMSMDAVKDYGEPYVKAVNAGNNLIITGEFEAAYNEVMGAVEDGRISGETLDDAVKKTLEWKEDRF